MFLKSKTAKCILSIILFLCISLSFTVMAFADYVDLEYLSGESTPDLVYYDTGSGYYSVTSSGLNRSTDANFTAYYFDIENYIGSYLYLPYTAGTSFNYTFYDSTDMNSDWCFRLCNFGTSNVGYTGMVNSTFQSQRITSSLTVSDFFVVDIVTWSNQTFFRLKITSQNVNTLCFSTYGDLYNYVKTSLIIDYSSDSISNNFGDITFNVYALNSTNSSYEAYLNYTVNFTAYVNGGKFFLYVPSTVDNVDVDQSLGQYYSHETLKNMHPSEYGTKLGLYLFNEDGSYSQYENYYQWNDYFDTTDDGTLFAYNILVYEDIPAGDYSVTTSVRLPVVDGVSNVNVSQSTIIPLGGYYFIDDSTGVTDYGNSLNTALSSGAVSYETASQQLNTYINNYITTGSGDGSGSGAVSTEEASYLVAQQTLIQNQLLETYGSNQYEEHIEEYNENLQVIENANEEISQHEEVINEMQEDARHNFEDALTGFDDYIESEERDSIFTAIYEGNGGMVVTMMVGALLFGLIGFILYGKKA